MAGPVPDAQGLPMLPAMEATAPAPEAVQMPAVIPAEQTAPSSIYQTPGTEAPVTNPVPVQQVQPQAPQQHVYMGATLPNGQEIVIFSADGSKKGFSEFEMVVKNLVRDEKDGKKFKQPGGFIIHKTKSWGAGARALYEDYVGEPARQGGQFIQNVAAATDPPASGPQTPRTIPNMLMDAAKAAPGAAYDATFAPGRYMLGALGTQVKEGFGTPQQGAVNTALLLSSLGKPGHFLRNTSGVVPGAIRAGIGTGAHIGADMLMGKEERDEGFLARPLDTANRILWGEGIAAGLSFALGGGAFLSKRASNQVHEESLEMLTRHYPEVGRPGPDGMEAIMSTWKGMQDLLRIGSKALRSDMQDWGGEIGRYVEGATGTKLSAITRKITGDLSRDMVKVFDTYLDTAPGSPQQAVVLGRIAKIQQDIVKALRDEIGIPNPKNPNAADILDPIVQRNLNGVFHHTKQRFERMQDGADLIRAYKEASKDGKMPTPEGIQLALRDAKRQASPLLGEAQDIAFRGAAGGPTDSPILPLASGAMGWMQPILNVLSGGAATKFTRGLSLLDKLGGTHHAGRVRGTYPAVPVDMAVVNEFRKPVKRDDQTGE